MKVFYAASFHGKKRFQRYYDRVLEAIVKTGVDVVSPELNNYMPILKKSENSQVKDPKMAHYEAIRKGIKECDVVIIEVSNEDFQLGHEVTLAMQGKKPVLCLSLFEDFAQKIDNKYMYGSRYNEFSIDEIVEKFVRKVQKNMCTERFNLFLTPSQMEFIKEQAELNGITMSEYVRELIETDREATPV
jgi:nucleoside 2-deoxyribosyltransferase